MAERWRPVPACRWFGIPPRVFAGSDKGNAATVGRTLTDGREAGGVVLEGTPDQDGYLRVTYGKRKLGVAVLVCLAWHGPPEVRHLNGNCQDNRPENLAWGSHRENEQDKKEKRKKGKEEGIRTSSVPRSDIAGT